MRTVLNAIFGLQTLPPIHGDREYLQAVNRIVNGIRISNYYFELQGCKLGIERLILDRYPYENVKDTVKWLNSLIADKEKTIQGGYGV